MRLYLIGFMASGKSTLGQRVALTANVPFFDIDSTVESQAGLTIPEIFKSHGEDYFRQLEADVLRQTTFYSKSINAAGGGLPMYEDNMAWINIHGITVYLQWPDELILKHVFLQRANRPLLSHLSDVEAQVMIKNLLQERKPVYENAAITIEMKGNEEQDFLLLLRACKYIW